MVYKITYFDLMGIDEDGTKDYRVNTIRCEDEGELKYFLHCINEEDILKVEEI